MRVIKRGILPTEKSQELTCRNCESVFKVLNSEAYKPATKMHIQYISKKYLPSKDWKSISRTYPDKKMQTAGHYILIL